MFASFPQIARTLLEVLTDGRSAARASTLPANTDQRSTVHSLVAAENTKKLAIMTPNTKPTSPKATPPIFTEPPALMLQKDALALGLERLRSNGSVGPGPALNTVLGGTDRLTLEQLAAAKRQEQEEGLPWGTADEKKKASITQLLELRQKSRAHMEVPSQSIFKDCQS